MAENIYGAQQNPYYQGPQATFFQNRPTAKFTQPLTEGQINALRAEEDALTVKVDEKDIWRAQCTHKHNGASTLTKVPIYDKDGNLIREDYKCSICGAQFTFFEGTAEDVKAAVKAVDDIMQTCKTINFDIPAELASAYFQFLPLLRMLPIMYDRSYRNFQRYANVDNGGVYAGSSYMPNNWGLLGSLTAQPFYGQPVAYQYPQQPVQYAYPQAVPQYAYPQQPVQYAYPQTMPQQGYAQAPQQNPFVMNAPAPGVIPQPGAPAPQAAPVQPTQTPDQPEVVQNKSFNL